MVCQFWVLRFVPPEQMGVWSFITLLQGYALITQFGIVNAMNREYPFYTGRGEQDKAQGVVQTAQAYALCNGALLSAVFLALMFGYGGRGWEWRIALLTAAGTLPLAQYASYLEGTYRSGNEFRALSNIRLAQALTTAITVGLPWRYGFGGYCMQVFLLTLQPAVLGFLFRPVKLAPAFRPGFLRLLYATGWRLHLWNYLYRIAQSFPRLALATLGGTLHLGLFVPVSVAYSAASNIAGSFSVYLYPKLTQRFAQRSLPVGRVALKSSLVTMACLAAPLALGVVVMPMVVPPLLPRYAASVPAAQVALVASLLECMTMATVAFAAAKAWRQMSVYIGCSLLVRAGAAFGGYYLSNDHLLGVACGMLSASLIMGVVTWFTVSAIPSGTVGGAEVVRPVAGTDETRM